MPSQNAKWQQSAPRLEISSRRKNPNLHLIHMRMVAWVGVSQKTGGCVAELILCDINRVIAGVSGG